MQEDSPKNISNFFIAGINYKKADVSIRGQFAINDDQYAAILKNAPDFGITELFIVSTCNRTEVYGFAENVTQLCNLLCTQTEGSVETFVERGYTKQGPEAITHLLNVGSGLDSQILGDYEIVGQIKHAAKFAKKHGRIHTFTERLLNCMLQASKAIKNQTSLSGGTVSVSFAAIQYIREHVKFVKNKKILLLGTGKIGRNTCKNLVDYIGTKNVTLINRTEKKAIKLAAELGLTSASIGTLTDCIGEADIIFVATNSLEPVVLRSHLLGLNRKLIIDLSMPHNVEPSVRQLSNITLINVDELSKMKDETLANRKAEVPKANIILLGHITEFMEWYRLRNYALVLKAVKTKLREIHTSPFFIYSQAGVGADEKIQKVINSMATKMKEQNQQGCQYIEAINEFIAIGSN